MKRVNDFIGNNLLGLLVSIVLFGILTIGLLIISSNKYEDDISRLKIENKKLEHKVTKANNTITDYKEEHPECEYYIHPSGDDFVIDGQLYEKAEGYEAYE